MSALALLAAYGDDDDSDAPVANQPEPAKGSDDTGLSAALTAVTTTSAQRADETSASQRSAESPAFAPSAPSSSASRPSSPIAPSRTPSSLISTIRHLLPPPPHLLGTTNPAVEAKIQTFFAALQRGHSVSVQLRSSKRFNNPDILEKLVSFFELDEAGSNYDPQVFDPRAPFLHAEDYKTLAERQAAGHQPTGQRRGVEFVAAGDKEKDGDKDANPAPATGDKGKRSKWDVTEEEGGPVAKIAKPAASVTKQPVQEMSAYRQFLEKRKAEGK